MNNMRNYYLFIIVFIGLIIFSGLLYISYTIPDKKPESKTKITQSNDKKWYIRFSVKQQKTTAYTEETNALRPANGKTYFIGGIAVHPRSPVQSGGNQLQPLLPFGTVIYLKEPIKIQDKEYKSLTVMDTGDVNYGLWSAYPYWFDAYYGSSNYYNIKEARKYGVPQVDYYWYEEWK